jgi:endonuclease/exonuclease/phosphatase family metal-dependent hydrolase
MKFNSKAARFMAGMTFLAALIASFGLQAQSNVTVRVMAANLNGNTQSYQPFALRILQGLKPDVVCIQEFNYANNTASDFRQMVETTFGTNFVYYREPYTANGDIPNGIISRYPIVAAGSWADMVQTQPNRGFAWARIDLPGTNDLYVVSVHLLTSSASNRGAEADDLKTLIQSNFPTNAWIVVAGDFNTDSRTESPTMPTFDSYLSDNPVPADNNGNSNTSGTRTKPHDYVLPSFSLTNWENASVFPSHSFTNGLVFDSTVYVPLSDVPPIQFGDSTNAQHMAVMKDFSIPAGTNDNAVPYIATQPRSQSVVQGSNVTFTVTADGTVPLFYQWRFGGTNIAGATTNFYSIVNVQATNAGDYSVVVSNFIGSITSSVASLTVITAPVITTNPVSQSVIQGGTANFSVAAIGIQPLSYQWRFNGTNISGAATNPFTLTNVQLADAGNYSVLVTNVAGSITSTVATLTVTFASTGTVVTLAGWDMSGLGNYGPSPMPATTNAPLLTIGGLTRGSGVTTLNTAAARTWGGNNFNSASADAAIAASQYATFSISANAGYQVSFTSISKYDYKRSSAGPPNGILQFQVGSGAFTDITNFAYTSTSGASLGPIDLSTIAALQNVGPGNVATFRLVNYGASSSGGNWYIFDLAASPAPDLMVQGIISTVPPPVLGSAVLNGNGQFQFNVTGQADANYIVQFSTNLAAGVWFPLLTNTAPFTFTETNAAADRQRFYRVVLSP